MLKSILAFGFVLALEVLFAVVGGQVFGAAGWSPLTPALLAQSAAVGTAVIGAPLTALLVSKGVKPNKNPLHLAIGVPLTAAMYAAAGAAILGLKSQAGFATLYATVGAAILFVGAMVILGTVIAFLPDTHANVKLPAPVSTPGVRLALKSPLTHSVDPKPSSNLLHSYVNATTPVETVLPTRVSYKTQPLITAQRG